MGIYTEFEKFKLLSLSQDYTYIENRISHLFLQNLGIWPLHTFYAEVMLNNHHQGLYLFVEYHQEYLFTNNKADVVLRRYYQNELSKVEVNPSKNITDSTAYVNRFYSIYDSIVTLKGEQLYNEMASVFNIQNYMRKMIFDFLILNGDYTDEIYFYGNKLENGSIYFDIIPWDYDDIFTSRPHEIGRDWAVGNSFGVRAYANHDEVKAVVGDRFIFSIEDDIDYVISIDDYLYSKYLDEVKFVLSVLTESKVDEVFQSTRAELIPLYAKPEIIEQSVFDSDSTSVYFLEKLNVEKSEFLKKRIRLFY
jgi:spore coat protein H